MTNRREMILSTLAAAVCPTQGDDGDDIASRAKAHADTMARQHPDWMGHETIAMLLYPGFTALDLFGPEHMLAA